MSLVFFGIALFVIGGLLTIFTPEKYRSWLFMAISIVAQFLIVPTAFSVLAGGQSITTSIDLSGPIGTANFVLDPLAAFFGIIISVGGMLSAIYSEGYMKMYKGNALVSLPAYYFFMGLLISAMFMVVIIQNGILFLIAWEIMSLASFFLVTFENQKEDVRKAGLYYFVAMHIGAAFLITAFAWSGLATESLNFSDFSLIGQANPAISSIIFLLFVVGFGTKAGLIPLHSWLPKAHPAAPTGVSSIMSGVMIKTGIYGILRMILVFSAVDNWIAYFIFAIGLLSGMLGVMNAIAQHDLKKLLAYHSVENIGIIGIGMGLGMIGINAGQPLVAAAGFLGAILHVFNHFTFKSLLFYGAGIVYQKTHTRSMDKLGGLIHVMPFTAALFLIGAIAISGLPLLNGFISEFALYFGLASGLTLANLALNLSSVIGLSGLAFIGVMAVLCFTKVFGVCFQGSPRDKSIIKNEKTSLTMIIPMAVLAVFILVIGLFFPLILPWFKPLIQQFAGTEISESWNVMAKIFRQLTSAMWIFLSLIAVFAALRALILRGRVVTEFNTWGCGYQAENPRAQYTSSSYASSFLGLVNEFVLQKKIINQPKGLFPKHADFESHSSDIFERLIINPVIKSLHKSLHALSWIQSGHTQRYILYGLIFLLLLVSWVIGVH